MFSASLFAFPLVPNTYYFKHSFKQLSELFIVAILFTFVCEKGGGFCALLSCILYESEVEKSCVKPEQNQPTFIFDGEKEGCQRLPRSIGKFFLLILLLLVYRPSGSLGGHPMCATTICGLLCMQIVRIEGTPPAQFEF